MHLTMVTAVKVAKSRSRASERARRATAIAMRQVATFRERAGFLWELKSFVRQSLVALLASLVIVIFAGIFFGSLREALLALPGLVLLVPGALAQRGNIFAALGARVGTGLHTGEIPPRLLRSPPLVQQIIATVVQTLIGSLALAFLGYGVAFLLDVHTASLQELAVTAALGSLIAGAVILGTTLYVAVEAYRKGWDPDNVTAPIISSAADLVEIPALLGAALLVVEMPGLVTDSVFIVLMVAASASWFLLRRRGHRKAMEVLRGSMPVLIAVLAIVIVPAIILEMRVDDLVDNPTILIMLPPFLAMAGNLGAILASRLSSMAFLGLITTKGTPDRLVWQNFGVILLLAFAVFGALGPLVHGATVAMGLESPGGLTLLTMSLVGGIIITLVTSYGAYKVTAFTFRHGDDPDNVVIPIITSSMDAVGTVLLIALAIVLVL